MFYFLRFVVCINLSPKPDLIDALEVLPFIPNTAALAVGVNPFSCFALVLLIEPNLPLLPKKNGIGGGGGGNVGGGVIGVIGVGTIGLIGLIVG